MKRQKTKMLVMFSLGLLLSGIFAENALAAVAGGTVSWIAPTTNDDGPPATTLTDLDGFRVYYSTSAIDCTDWNAATVDERKNDDGTLLPTTFQDVANPAKLRFSFSTTSVLNTNSTYNFAVVAYDTSNNPSKCATAPDGITNTVSKLVTFPADISNGTCTTGTHCVNGADYSLLHAAYSVSVAKPGNVADINGDDYVNGGDYSFLHAEYNQYF